MQPFDMHHFSQVCDQCADTVRHDKSMSGEHPDSHQAPWERQRERERLYCLPCCCMLTSMPPAIEASTATLPRKFRHIQGSPIEVEHGDRETATALRTHPLYRSNLFILVVLEIVEDPGLPVWSSSKLRPSWRALPGAHMLPFILPRVVH